MPVSPRLSSFVRPEEPVRAVGPARQVAPPDLFWFDQVWFFVFLDFCICVFGPPDLFWFDQVYIFVFLDFCICVLDFCICVFAPPDLFWFEQVWIFVFLDFCICVFGHRSD